VNIQNHKNLKSHKLGLSLPTRVSPLGTFLSFGALLVVAFSLILPPSANAYIKAGSFRSGARKASPSKKAAAASAAATAAAVAAAVAAGPAQNLNDVTCLASIKSCLYTLCPDNSCMAKNLDELTNMAKSAGSASSCAEAKNPACIQYATLGARNFQDEYTKSNPKDYSQNLCPEGEKIYTALTGCYSAIVQNVGSSTDVGIGVTTAQMEGLLAPICGASTLSNLKSVSGNEMMDSFLKVGLTGANLGSMGDNMISLNFSGRDPTRAKNDAAEIAKSYYSRACSFCKTNCKPLDLTHYKKEANVMLQTAAAAATTAASNWADSQLNKCVARLGYYKTEAECKASLSTTTNQIICGVVSVEGQTCYTRVDNPNWQKPLPKCEDVSLYTSNPCAPGSTEFTCTQVTQMVDGTNLTCWNKNITPTCENQTPALFSTQATCEAGITAADKANFTCSAITKNGLNCFQKLSSNPTCPEQWKEAACPANTTDTCKSQEVANPIDVTKKITCYATCESLTAGFSTKDACEKGTPGFSATSQECTQATTLDANGLKCFQVKDKGCDAGETKDTCEALFAAKNITAELKVAYNCTTGTNPSCHKLELKTCASPYTAAISGVGAAVNWSGEVEDNVAHVGAKGTAEYYCYYACPPTGSEDYSIFFNTSDEALAEATKFNNSPEGATKTVSYEPHGTYPSCYKEKLQTKNLCVPTEGPGYYSIKSDCEDNLRAKGLVSKECTTTNKGPQTCYTPTNICTDAAYPYFKAGDTYYDASGAAKILNPKAEYLSASSGSCHMIEVKKTIDSPTDFIGGMCVNEATSTTSDKKLNLCKDALDYITTGYVNTESDGIRITFNNQKNPLAFVYSLNHFEGSTMYDDTIKNLYKGPGIDKLYYMDITANIGNLDDPNSKFTITQETCNGIVSKLNVLLNGSKVSATAPQKGGLQPWSSTSTTKYMPYRNGESRSIGFSTTPYDPLDNSFSEVDIKNLTEKIASLNLACPNLPTKNEMSLAIKSSAATATNCTTFVTVTHPARLATDSNNDACYIGHCNLLGIAKYTALFNAGTGRDGDRFWSILNSTRDGARSRCINGPSVSGKMTRVWK
jgi:hypothetical protein